MPYVGCVWKVRRRERARARVRVRVSLKVMWRCGSVRGDKVIMETNGTKSQVQDYLLGKVHVRSEAEQLQIVTGSLT